VARGNVLISGASVAGPTLAYWLHRAGFRVTVVERSSSVRRGWGGQAVDIFGPAVDIVERMGLLPRVTAARTRTELITFVRPGRRSVDIDLARLVGGVSDRHVEIMRGELAAILHEATRDDVEYLFGDHIRTLDQTEGGVEVSFHGTAARRFDVVVGADGLHSAVRRGTFGDESQFLRYLGGYLAVYSVPDHLELHGRMLTYLTPGKLAATYPVPQTGQARAAFLFRRREEFVYDHRDLDRQRQLLRDTYSTDGWEVPRLLDDLADADDFYFDSISQIVMNSWSDGRVTLVGDAGYSPGPAVGGGTSVAVIGARLLAAALDRADGDHRRAFDHYQQAMGELVTRTRAAALTTMKTLIPVTSRQVWVTIQAMRLMSRVPATLQRRLFAFQAGPAAALHAVTPIDEA
jgi:2-polyprenyl-6-methoxyphenol hydroxylase-like FAD-dependent oxidoreductase